VNWRPSAQPFRQVEVSRGVCDHQLLLFGLFELVRELYPQIRAQEFPILTEKVSLLGN
jgi:hypothetical protein